MIAVGTASWTDKSLIASKRFYPKGCTSAEDRLRYYASRFPIVEVDSSYYAMPSAANSRLWAERTPEGFTFNVKAFRALTTHQTPIVALPKDLQSALPAGGKKNVYLKDMSAEAVNELWERYIGALHPLSESGKLGALHFQFPPWFTAARGNYEYLDEVRERLSQYTVAVEFRHKSWFADDHRDATLKYLSDRQFVNVIVDEPQGHANSVPAVWEVTNPALALVRLHGRNEETWNIKDATAASDRFNYDYSASELKELAGSIQKVSQSARRTHVIFNNNFEDQGPRNAASLMAIIGQEKPYELR